MVVKTCDMTRTELIKEVKRYFDLQELVCSHTFERYGFKSWQFLDSELLEMLLVLRTNVLKVPMVINNYHENGNYSQRGFRCNICEIPYSKTASKKFYASAHCLGKAVDFDAVGLTVKEVHALIHEKQDLLPYPIRLERGVTWNHIDLYWVEGQPKIYEFNPV